MARRLPDPDCRRCRGLGLVSVPVSELACELRTCACLDTGDARVVEYAWSTFYAAIGDGLSLCPHCGAAVVDANQHEAWHTALRLSVTEELERD